MSSETGSHLKDDFQKLCVDSCALETLGGPERHHTFMDFTSRNLYRILTETGETICVGGWEAEREANIRTMDKAISITQPAFRRCCLT